MVEIIPKPIKKPPLWLNILLYFSILSIIGVIGAYLLLGYFIEDNQQILKEKKGTLNQLRTDERRELEKEVFKYQRKIEDFTFLMNQRKNNSNFFSFFEEIIHPQVWISEMDLDVLSAQVRISGETEKTALGQQLLIFRENKQILDIKLSNLRAKEEETVSFNISFSLDPAIFKF